MLRLFFSLAKSVFKELLRASLLHSLLLKDVLQEVFVPLNQTLRVNLPVLNLLFSVSLDPLEERL